MKIQAHFLKHGNWWIAWTDDIQGSLSQGTTLQDARKNLIDNVHMLQETEDLATLPDSGTVVEEIEV